MMPFQLILCLIFDCQSIEVTTVRINHLGESDKPIISLCISSNLSQCNYVDLVKSIVVSEEELSLIVGFVKSQKEKFLSKNRQNLEMGSFEIVIEKGGKRDLSYVIDKRKESIGYLTRLLSASSTNIILKQEVENLIKRINY
jgi:hypothetical protein